MPATRNYQNLAALRNSVQAGAEDQAYTDEAPETSDDRQAHKAETSHKIPHEDALYAGVRYSPVTGRPDKRYLKKAIKGPSIQTSVQWSKALYDDLQKMLFAEETTAVAWLNKLVAKERDRRKETGTFPL